MSLLLCIYIGVFMLVLQLCVFGSAYDWLPSLGADTGNTGQQKSLSGVGKAESDFVVPDVEKTVISHLASSNPALRSQFETLIPLE